MDRISGVCHRAMLYSETGSRGGFGKLEEISLRLVHVER